MDKKISPKVFAIVVNYNGGSKLDSCLKSIFTSTYPNLNVIVVDNNSRDGSFEDAKNKYQKAFFIMNSENLGFAKANNLAIRLALEKMADYVFLLNNDAFIEKDAIEKMVSKAEKDVRIGIMSPVIYDGSGSKVWFSGGKIDWLKMKTSHFESIPKNCYSSDFISGCAMLASKQVFKKVGLFDEKFFLYYEDADLSIRAKRAGFSLYVDRDAKVFHEEQSNATNKEKVYWLVLSGLIFFKKNTPFILKPYVYVYIMLRKIKNSFDIFFNKGLFSMQVRKAFKDFKKHI